MSSDGPPLVRFADGKDPDAMRTIGEVAEALGLKTHILRYWEEQFPSLRPLKRSGGRRLYRAQDVALVARIDQLVNREGYTLKGARAVLAGAAPAVAEASTQITVPEQPAVSSSRAEVVGRLREIRERLAEALDS